MKIRAKTAIWAATFGCLGVFTSDIFAAPTIWKVLNQSPLPVLVTCESQDLPGLKNISASFQSPAIAPGATYPHLWGSAWHNDGMGLNAGTFTCRGALSSKAGSVKAVTFMSDWDELVEISISKLSGQFVLSKSPPHPREKMARSKN